MGGVLVVRSGFSGHVLQKTVGRAPLWEVSLAQGDTRPGLFGENVSNQALLMPGLAAEAKLYMGAWGALRLLAAQVG